MDWFRMYSEVVHDAKVQKLSPTMFKHWVNVLCLANNAEPRGRVPLPTDIAFGLRISEGRAAVLLDELLALQLLDADDEGNLYPHNWEARQFESDNSTARVQRFRNKKTVTRNVTSNVSETPPEADTETEQNRNRAEPEQSAGVPVQLPVIRAFEHCFGRPLSPMEIEGIKALDEEHPRDRIDYALREAADLNKRSVRYIQRVCENQSTAPMVSAGSVGSERKSDRYDN